MDNIGKKIVIFGTGNSAVSVLKTIKDPDNIILFLDNNPKKAHTEWQGKKVILPYELKNEMFDYIILAMVNDQGAIEQLNTLGYEKEKIIRFFDLDIEYAKYGHLMYINIWERMALKLYTLTKLEKINKEQQMKLQNIEYEIADSILQKKYFFPSICSVQDTYHKLFMDKASISRFGDGEFEIMAGRSIYEFQPDNVELGRRLKEVLVSNIENHMVAIANDYGDLSEYNEAMKYTTRRYMTQEVRKFHNSVLDKTKQYYNAYISRPYSIYPEHLIERAKDRFECLKKLWVDRDIVFIEGNQTFLGVGNDLFKDAKSISRIIAPNKNAFSKYEKILESARHLNKDNLILIALGPTATVLSYDLAKEGFQALDIGHLDLEYEWYLKGKGQTYITHKYNNEVPGDEYVIPVNDDSYQKQILVKIL